MNKNKHANSKLQRFVNKYGIDKLSFEIIEVCEKSDLIKLEQKYIDKLDCLRNGFNILPTAGSWLNMKHRKESIKKQSESKKGKKTCLGRILSDETKDKIRQKAIGRKQSDETIKKRVLKNTGKVRSESAKLATLLKNKKLSDDQVIEIRKLLNQGVFQNDIAKQFNICQRNVSRIKQGISYKQVI